MAKKNKKTINKKKVMLVGLAASVILSVAIIVGYSTFAATSPGKSTFGATTLGKTGDKIKFSFKVTTADGWTIGNKVDRPFDPKQLSCSDTGSKKDVCIDNTTVSKDHSIRYKAYPKKCFVFRYWMLDGKKVGGDTLDVKRNTNHTIGAYFREATSKEMKAKGWTSSCPKPGPVVF